MNIKRSFLEIEIKMLSIIVNNKQICYDKDEEKIYFPLLHTLDKYSRINYWKIYIVENEIYRESWIEGGKIKLFPKIECTPKNVGKKNETTPHQQAIFEAHSKWLKKQDQGYKEEQKDKNNTENSNSNSATQLRTKPISVLPMLAQKYEQRKKYLKQPFGVSPKLDGIRMIAQLYSKLDNDLQVHLSSRLGGQFKFINKIREHIKKLLIRHDNLSLILDGELYSHTLPFNVISGATRKTKEPSKCDDLLEYWIFDVADESLSYEYRCNILYDLEKLYKDMYKKTDRRLNFVGYQLAYCESHVEDFHNEYVSDGFEGVILRNLDGFYRFKYRVNDLQKYKHFLDDEFEIVGAEVGKGTEKDAIIFVCLDPKSGNTFTVRPRGEITERRKQWKEKEKYIGKKLTVRYQKTDDKEETLPRFPVGIVVRDYE